MALVRGSPRQDSKVGDVLEVHEPSPLASFARQLGAIVAIATNSGILVALATVYVNDGPSRFRMRIDGTSASPSWCSSDFLPYRLNVLASLTSQCTGADLCRAVRPHDPGLAGRRDPRSVRGANRARHRGSWRHAQIDGVAGRFRPRSSAASSSRRPNSDDRREEIAGPHAGGPRHLRGACAAGAGLRGQARLGAHGRRSRRTLRRARSTSSTATHASSRLRRGGRREALHLFPLLRRLSGADRAQSEGRPLRDGADQPAEGRAAAATPTVRSIRRAGCLPSIIGDAVLIQSPGHSRISRRGAIPSRPSFPMGAVQRAKVRAVGALIACDIHPLEQFRRRLPTSRASSGTTRRASSMVRALGREGFEAIER